jgi:hypothetical protein
MPKRQKILFLVFVPMVVSPVVLILSALLHRMLTGEDLGDRVLLVFGPVVCVFVVGLCGLLFTGTAWVLERSLRRASQGLRCPECGEPTTTTPSQNERIADDGSLGGEDH